MVNPALLLDLPFLLLCFIEWPLFEVEGARDTKRLARSHSVSPDGLG